MGRPQRNTRKKDASRGTLDSITTGDANKPNQKTKRAFGDDFGQKRTKAYPVIISYGVPGSRFAVAPEIFSLQPRKGKESWDRDCHDERAFPQVIDAV